MFQIRRIPPALRANPEFQSAVVRIGLWLFGLLYIGIAAQLDVFAVDYAAFLSLFSVYLVLYASILLSVLVRPVWEARRFATLFFDTLAVSLAIFLTGDPGSPFYLVYIWIFISAGTRYGRLHLAVAAGAAVVSYNVTLAVLGGWTQSPTDAVFRLLVLVLLPLYQDSLLVKLREARNAAERADQAKGAFLANMTHELRTPLTGVLGMANLLRRTRLDTQQREYLDAIASSASMLQALIGDILDLSKIDANKLLLEHSTFDLREPVMEVCEIIHTQALAKGLDLVCDVSPDIPARVVGDALRLRQVLFNLIGNAVKFTERGEVVVRASVAATPAPDGRVGVLLEVADTGIGISRDKLELIFESFRQADDSTTRRYGGTGLGTTIARDLIRLMQGDIAVDSEPGRGTCFRVWLPLLGQDCPAPSPAPRPRFDGCRVLIYERNAAQREIIHATCRDLGMQCFAERDIGRLGALMQRAGDIDLLIVADSPEPINLPELLESFHRLLRPGIPYLLLIYGQRRDALAAHCRYCLTKPFLREDLIDAVATALASRRAAHEGCVATTENAEDAADLEDAAAAPRPSDADADSVSALPMPQPAPDAPRVLVAEDNDIAATVIATLLREQAVAVTLVADGQQALDAVRRADFDLAFIDLRMPKIDGIEFTRRVRDKEDAERRLPIVALTANAAEDVKERCLAAGMDAFLTKPVAPDALARAVAKFVSR
jgi:two-component system, sensor histidine kinase RpfC